MTVSAEKAFTAFQQRSPLFPSYRYDFAQHYPKHYVAPAVADAAALGPLTGDVLNKPAWAAAPWSDLFQDITGTSNATSGIPPPPDCPTRVKMLVSPTHLHIGAHIKSNAGRPLTAFWRDPVRDRNEPIYQKDSDFEVFVDASRASTTQWYKEWEGNHVGTVWNLMLSKPYADGGEEHSGRVTHPRNNASDKTRFWDSLEQEYAVKVYRGRIGEPGEAVGEETEVGLELSLPLKDLMFEPTTTTTSQNPGDDIIKTLPKRLRINFSRVERGGLDNWVWQPMIAWDPSQRAFRGFVDMHRPDAWGYVQLGGADTEADPRFPLRLLAANAYYAQHAFAKQHGWFARSWDALADFLHDAGGAFWADVDVQLESGEPDDAGKLRKFTVTVREKGGKAEGVQEKPRWVSIRQDRRMSDDSLEEKEVLM